MLMGPIYTAWICTTARLPYFFITLGKLSSKMSLLVICGILGLFVKTMTADGKYFPCNSDILSETIQMKLSKKQKRFFQFFPHFWNLHQVLNILAKIWEP